jgi:phage shock protein PspC (stress-responsive transcriptional regulator)
MDYYDYYYHKKRVKHFRRSSNGIIFGVCQGISNYTGISVALIRITAIITFILTGFAPIGVIYLLLALLVPTKD